MTLLNIPARGVSGVDTSGDPTPLALSDDGRMMVASDNTGGDDDRTGLLPLPDF